MKATTCTCAPQVTEARGFPAVELWFQHLVRCHFKGTLKPPFNQDARQRAGFEESWYLPLVPGDKPKAAPDAAPPAGSS